jgi:hypothetical protein
LQLILSMDWRSLGKGLRAVVVTLALSSSVHRGTAQVPDRGVEVVARGDARLASQVLNRGAQTDFHGATQVLYSCPRPLPAAALVVRCRCSFFSKFRAPHRDTSLGSCVRGARAFSLCSYTKSSAPRLQ